MLETQYKTITAGQQGLFILFDNKKHNYINYKDAVKEIQLYGNAKYQQIEKRVFNPIQERLYSKIVYGFDAYTPYEIEKMSKPMKDQVKRQYTKVQNLINKWKQEILNNSVDNLLLSLFPKSKTIVKFTSVKGYNKDILCTVSLKEVGLSKIKIAEKLVEYHLLPKNFFKLI